MSRRPLPDTIVEPTLERPGTGLFDRSHIPHSKVLQASRLVDISGAPQAVSEWRIEDQGEPGLGGRPAMLDDRAMFALLLMVATEWDPMHLTRVASLITHRLSDDSKTALGITTASATEAEWYARTWRAFHRISVVVDPFPITRALGGDRRSRMTRAQFDGIVQARDVVECARKQRRINQLANMLLEASWQFVPRDIQRRWKGNACIDGTKIRTHAQRNPRNDSLWASIEPDAGYHCRGGDHSDKKENGERTAYGFEGNLAILIPNTGEAHADFPQIVLAMSFDRPGVAPGENAAVAFQSLVERKHPVGVVVADRGILPNSMPHKLQEPLAKLGYEFAFDYKIDQLGLKAGHEGAIQVEGAWYCPSMPPMLIEATLVYRGSKKATTDPKGIFKGDRETWLERIAERKKYLLRPNGRPDASGKVRLMCPAVGPNATADCPLRENNAAPGRRQILVVPETPGKICTNAKDVTFDRHLGVKYNQKFQYGTAKWELAYKPGRAAIEGFNGFAKDGGYEALEDGSRRRVRGYAAQFILTAFLVVSANLRKIEAFLNLHPEDLEKKFEKSDRRKQRALNKKPVKVSGLADPPDEESPPE